MIKYYLERLSRWIAWIRLGKPMITYEGYHCGCCGTWVDEQFKIPTYKSTGTPMDDRLGICCRCTSHSYDIDIRPKL